MPSDVHQVLTPNDHVASEARLRWTLFLSPVHIFTLWLQLFIRHATSECANTNKL